MRKGKRINEYGYVEKRVVGRRGNEPASWRNWWLLGSNNTGTRKGCYGRLYLGTLTFPERYIGKKVRFKIEILEEEKGN